MNTKLIIAATIAGLSLATTAFAGEGQGEPFPFHPALVSNGTAANQGETFNNAVLAPNGQNGAVESANSLPQGAWAGTLANNRSVELRQWYAQQADHRFAQRNVGAAAGPNS